jgi:hypothetical protein
MKERGGGRHGAPPRPYWKPGGRPPPPPPPPSLFVNGVLPYGQLDDPTHWSASPGVPSTPQSGYGAGGGFPVLKM